MLPKKYKIKGRYRVQRIFEKGKRIRGGQLFLLYYFPAKKGAYFSVIIPKKLKLNAVKRNCCRRRIYSALRHLLPLTNGKNCDIVILAKDSLEKTSFEQIVHELKSTISKL